VSTTQGLSTWMLRYSASSLTFACGGRRGEVPSGGAERARRGAEGCGGSAGGAEGSRRVHMARRECEEGGRCRKAGARLARRRAVDLERARGPPLVGLVDCAVRGKQPQALSMPWRSQRRTGACGSLRAGSAGGRRARGRRGVVWRRGVEGWGRCGVAAPLRARLCMTTISVPSSAPSNMSPSRPLRVTTTWPWERCDANSAAPRPPGRLLGVGRLRRLQGAWRPRRSLSLGSAPRGRFSWGV
jgi:hypothetical protein